MTNTVTAIVLSTTWLTNHIERPPEPRRGPVWYRTNIVSVQTVGAVVGPGIVPPVYYTNTVVLSTNVTRLRITEESVDKPLGSQTIPISPPPMLWTSPDPRGLPPLTVREKAK